MKIAFIIPSLINEGPVIVTKDIIEGLINKVDLIDVYYFDERENAISFPCNTYKISFFEKIDFNKYDVVHTHLDPTFTLGITEKKLINVSSFPPYTKLFTTT